MATWIRLVAACCEYGNAILFSLQAEEYSNQLIGYRIVRMMIVMYPISKVCLLLGVVSFPRGAA
jgi:hypothetical protein